MKKYLLSFIALGALAGCSSSPPQTFAPLDYSYLPPIVLKVATLNVVNNYVPTPSQATVEDQAPQAPAVVLMGMLNHRIVPSGQPGSGTVTVEVASIDNVGGTISGTMTVDIRLTGAPGANGAAGATGYTEASVSASQPAPDPDASQNDVQASLYALTKQLMNSMNVQLQYQIQHNLPDWVSWSAAPGASALTTGASPVPGAIQAAPLSAPGSVASPAPAGSPETGMPAGPANPVNTNPAVPAYLPGAGPAALPAQAQ